MATVVYKTIFQFKRGNASALSNVNPPLAAGEPCFELDTGKLKIGNGVDPWNSLEYYGGDYAIAADGQSIALDGEQLKLYGFSAAAAGYSPRKAEDGTLEWFRPVTAEELESLITGKGGLQEHLVNLDKTTQKVKYEVTNKPDSALVSYQEKEIRIMCPVDTEWKLQSVGPTGDQNRYYIGFRAYAPSEAVSFKEDTQDTIQDQTMYYFEDNDFAGVDQYGRKYSIVWLPAAAYNPDTATWTYYGANSTKGKYIGWYYSVEWYNAVGALIDSDMIRVNLSNESCHNDSTPYYLGSYQKKSDPIPTSRLVDDGILILFGGDATEGVEA